MTIRQKYNQHQPLFESFISLYILNGLNLVLPLVSLPYLLRVVGPANYGIYAFVYVVVQYVMMVSNYGFDFSATKQVAQSRHDPQMVSRIYHSVIATRMMLAVAAIALVAALSPLFMKSREHYIILWLGLGMVVGDLLVPTWLFQGLEKMRYMTLVNFISKVLFTVLIFVVIREASDFRYIILLNALGSIVAGFASTIIVYRVLQLKFIRPAVNDVVFQLKDGLAVFGSTLGMNFYRNSNVFILGLFVSDAAVGIYAAAERVIKAIQSVLSPVAQALFPHLSSKFATMSVQEGIKFLLRIAGKFAILLFVLAVFTYIGAGYIVGFFGGVEYQQAIPLIRVLSVVVLIGGLNYLLGIVGLINLNRKKDFFWNVMVSGGISVFFLLMMVGSMGTLAAVWSMVLSELILFGGCAISLFMLYKRKYQANEYH